MKEMQLDRDFKGIKVKIIAKPVVIYDDCTEITIHISEAFCDTTNELSVLYVMTNDFDRAVTQFDILAAGFPHERLMSAVFNDNWESGRVTAWIRERMQEIIAATGYAGMVAYRISSSNVLSTRPKE